MLPAALARALSEPHVVSRPAPLDRLRRAAASATAGGGLAVLSGEPGIGTPLTDALNEESS